MLFVIPWGRHWIIGTTDTDWDARQGAPGRVAERHRLPARPRQRGARPRRSPARTSRASTPGCGRCWRASPTTTSKLSREHVVAHPVPGLVVVAGGKYTTYRVMAADAVDAVRPRARRPRRRRRCTDRIPLVGAEGYQPRVERPAPHRAVAPACTWPGSSTCCTGTARAPRRCSTLVAADPRARPPARRAPTTTCAAEVVYAASHEGARHLDDVLARRTRISIETWDRGVGAAPQVAGLMAEVLGWSEEQVPARSSTTWPGSRPSASRSSSPTTRPPTPPASAPPRSSRSPDAIRPV